MVDKFPVADYIYTRREWHLGIKESPIATRELFAGRA